MTTAVEDIEDIQTVLGRIFPAVHADGDIGRVTLAALHSLQGRPAIVRIQSVLERRFPEVEADGVLGPLSFSAIAALDELGDHESMAQQLATLPAPGDDGWHEVVASSFADTRDVQAFNSCKDKGGSDLQCFKVGDNGIGKWGANCASSVNPLVALPREVWRAAGKKGGDIVLLRMEGVAQFAAQLGDTMPSLDNLTTAARLDTNPACGLRFRKAPPYMLKGVFWKWG